MPLRICSQFGGLYTNTYIYTEHMSHSSYAKIALYLALQRDVDEVLRSHTAPAGVAMFPMDVVPWDQRMERKTDACSIVHIGNIEICIVGDWPISQISSMGPPTHVNGWCDQPHRVHVPAMERQLLASVITITLPKNQTIFSWNRSLTILTASDYNREYTYVFYLKLDSACMKFVIKSIQCRCSYPVYRKCSEV